MIKYYYPIPLIANALLVLQWYLLMEYTYPRRYSKTVTYVSEAVLFAAFIFLGSVLPFGSMIRGTLFPVLFTAGFIPLYRERWYKIVCTVAGLYLVLLFTELITALFIYTPEELAGHFSEQPPLRQIQTYLCSMPTAAILTWLLYLLLNRQKNKLSGMQWMLCAAFTLIQTLIMFGYLQELSLDTPPHRKFYVAFILLAGVIMDIFLFHYVLTTIRREQLQKENQLLSSQIDAQLNRYTTITAEYEAVRHMRHDIAKHLNTMEALLKNGEHQEAEQYISELKSGSYRPSTQFCENPAVDALLNSYRDRTAETGPVLDVQVQVPAHAGFRNSDLICAFGNLLDNALEACPAGDGVITLRSAFTRGCLAVSIDNPIGNAGERQSRIPELERGIGTRILNHLAQTYSGAYEPSVDAQGFHARLTLMAAEADHATDRSL